MTTGGGKNCRTFGFRIDDDDAFLGREPKFSVLVLMLAGCLPPLHSLFSIPSSLPYPILFIFSIFAVGKIVQFLTFDTINSAIRTDPKISAVIFLNRKNIVIV